MGLMGRPIEVPKKDEPTDEEVEAVHQILMKQMVDLFDRHKAAYGWESKRLIIK